MNLKSLLIILFSLFTFLSCEEEEQHDVFTKVPIEKVFDPIITDMVSSSPIEIPNGLSYNYKIINSKNELSNYIPLDIIENPTSYDNIDYNIYSLISLKIRTFYKPNKIEYKIYKDVNGNISIVQQLYVTNELNTKGYYTMSNIVTSKIDEKSTISLSQSFYFE